jgi:hypothetical protein
LKLTLALPLFAAQLMAGTQGAATTLTIPGTANIFGAGHAVAPAPGGGTPAATAGGTLPPLFAFAAGPDQVLAFSTVTGLVGCCAGIPPNTPNGADGGTFIDSHTGISSFGGISGINHSHRTMFLVGVFLDGAEPTGAAPPVLSFSQPEDFTVSAPALRQTFFIGDGRTDTGSVIQQFLVPATATRLFLGFADGAAFGSPSAPVAPGQYGDNTGSLQATFEIVPEPRTGLLLGFALAALRWGGGRTRRPR